MTTHRTASRYRMSQGRRDGSLAGLALLDHAAKVIDQVNRMAHEMSDYVAGARGHRVSAAAAGTGTRQVAGVRQVGRTGAHRASR
ncbi:hypothetical protein DF156_25750 [Burkholderia ubonensis]|nr:hypothetical protein DF155_24895 [Burkholderia ubonensis]RQP34854.1 hypothetical protein DF156_25750 [Burkholderia ubonensis]RQP45455.1 hypothetical protein DF154_02145 [Burkholderia ubonensis]RQP49914.1 hypothetical protein DF144_23900 [Burkholderia ubonensis]RQP57617.1 hypothetical protein DF159_21595 [Burkholderia ubonensis]